MEMPEFPSVGNALSFGWHRMKANFLLFFLVVIVLTVINLPLEVDEAIDVGGASLGLLVFAYWLLFAPVIEYGADWVILRGVRGDDVEIKDIAGGFYRYLYVVLASLLVFGLVVIALILFIIPGIYVACRLAFVSYLVMDEDLDPIAAVETSWRMTKGNVLTIFLLGLMSGVIVFLGLLMLIVGVIPAVMWVKSSFASLYLIIQEDEDYPLEDDIHATV